MCLCVLFVRVCGVLFIRWLLMEAYFRHKLGVIGTIVGYLKAAPCRRPQNFLDFFSKFEFFFYLKLLKIWVFGIFGGHLRISHIFLLQNAIGNTPGDAQKV